MRRRCPAPVVAIGVLVAIAGAAQAAGEPVVIGEEWFGETVGIAPKALSKTEPTPAALRVDAEVHVAPPAHPPALRELQIELDRNIGVNLDGVPACHFGVEGPLEPGRECRSAQVGTGSASFGIAFYDVPDVAVTSRLLVFNGGEKNGIRTLFMRAYITVPVPAAIVTRVKITKIHHGRYGLLLVASIPKIVGGAGSITSFDFTIDRQFTNRGKRFSVVTASCRDGRLQAAVTGVFADGTSATKESVRPCRGRD